MNENQPVKKPSEILSRLQKITSEVEPIPMNGWNKHFGFAYVKAEDVIEATRILMVKHGVFHFDSVLKYDREVHGNNFHSTMAVRATFACAEDAEDFIHMNYYGVGADTQDKDLYKANTNGVKYLYIRVFKIPTELPDVEKDPHVKVSTSEQGGFHSTPPNQHGAEQIAPVSDTAQGTCTDCGAAVKGPYPRCWPCNQQAKAQR